jgi:hypothetical protein
MKNEHLPAYTQAATKEFLVENGTSGTIYALVFPESRQILEDVLDGGNREDILHKALTQIFARNAAPNQQEIFKKISQALAKGRKEYTNIFEAAWTSRQDSVDFHFFEAWKKWSAPVLSLSNSVQKYAYPTAGASEALRETINHHKIKTPDASVHIFEGEYEGFKAYATAANINIIMHNRNTWQDSIHKILPGDKVYISQPSAIDGNIWDGFDDFARTLRDQTPYAKIMLDITYVGAVAKNYHIDATHPNIDTVFFSLSKPFGVYYHRIGGMFTQTEYPSLMGNKWFKILPSLQLGTALLERSTVFDLPRKYKAAQDSAMQTVGHRLGLTLTSSDVILFGTAQQTDENNEIQNALLRGGEGRKFIRLCVTPEMARIIPGAVFMPMKENKIEKPSAVNGPKIAEMRFET